MLTLFTALLAGYLLGGVPSSLIVSRWLYKIDIREHGSGNDGFTNVLRVLGWKPGIIVFVLDLTKGFVAVLLVSQIRIGDSISPVSFETVRVLVGTAAIAGHIWSAFANFMGGKGVLCALGVYLALVPVPVLICFAAFVVIVAVTRYVSAGSMLAALLLPVILTIQRYTFGQEISNILYGISIATAILIVFTHRSNIKRLLSGTENRFSIGRGLNS